MIKFHRFSLVATILFVASIPALAATVGSRFDPNDYASNGALTLVDGDVLEFNTNAGTLSYTVTNTSIVTNSGTGVLVNSESQLAGVGGNTSGDDGVYVQMAMFNFDSITIVTGSSVSVSGNLGLVLGSKGDIYTAKSITVNGTGGSGNAVGEGGPGAEGGVRRNSFLSNPPSSTAGNGGADGGGTIGNATNGVGYGGGDADNSGSGGGYGGYGNRGESENNNNQNGTVYGDEELTLLFGGSGGGGSGANNNTNDSSGGGSGGAIELTALGTITIADGGTVRANGGNGSVTTGGSSNRGSGAGSGGGILINAPTVILEAGAFLSADGGEGAEGNSAFDGGGGGGGRIAIYADTLTLADATVITDYYDVTEGSRGLSSSLGTSDGTFYTAAYVPEPATMSLLALGGMAMIRRRKK